MDDLTDASQGADTGVADVSTGGATEVTSGDTSESNGSGGNPAWKPLQEKLGISFGLIQDDLKAMDQAAQSRIQSVNQQYAPFKSLVEQGYTPQSIQQALQIAKEIETDPLAFNQKYQNFLQATGRLPQTAGEVMQAEGMEDDAEQDGDQQNLDPQLEQLRQEQAGMREFIQNFQFQQITAEAERDLDSQTETLRTAHPEFTPDDVKDALRHAAQMTITTGKVASLEEGAQAFIATRNRILSQPRAGDSAPKLLPTSGGSPTASGQAKSLGSMNRNEVTDLLAGMIAQSK